MDSSVFNRGGGYDTISERTYNLFIGGILAYGFAVNYWVVANIPADAIPTLPLIIGYFVLALTGIVISNVSDDAVISFIGYNLVVIPVGFVLNVALEGVNPDIIMNAMLATGMVTAIMMVLGSLYPGFFRRIEGALFWSLLAAIVVELFLIFILGQDLAIMDMIVILIFSGYIGFDWGRAQSIAKTPDNAVDVCVALYLDIINIFIRFVSLMSGDD